MNWEVADGSGHFLILRSFPEAAWRKRGKPRKLLVTIAGHRAKF